MMNTSAIRSYFRDLTYNQEESLALLEDIKQQLSLHDYERVKDNLIEKQIIITKIIDYLDNEQEA
ncbi:MAG: hypothetical protein TR69_WS6001000223 [candidate division WS6 bacterium OLB20]|uniref:Uncharacterized protein n=1 Tax=candidate division WS6 bacterium OLB20 TaxID=1617426 RepID=A0A136M0B6_9BACT|nr:MAG: hypothetical protein TR69_WS6001000223 [candidate division WS6 bacterium OLB20]